MEPYRVRTRWFSEPEEIYEFDSLAEARACVAWAEHRGLWWALERCSPNSPMFDIVWS
jgi:hypothetical protein